MTLKILRGETPKEKDYFYETNLFLWGIKNSVMVHLSYWLTDCYYIMQHMYCQDASGGCLIMDSHYVESASARQNSYASIDLYYTGAGASEHLKG